MYWGTVCFSGHPRRSLGFIIIIHHSFILHKTRVCREAGCETRNFVCDVLRHASVMEGGRKGGWGEWGRMTRNKWPQLIGRSCPGENGCWNPAAYTGKRGSVACCDRHHPHTSLQSWFKAIETGQTHGRWRLVFVYTHRRFLCGIPL